MTGVTLTVDEQLPKLGNEATAFKTVGHRVHEGNTTKEERRTAHRTNRRVMVGKVSQIRVERLLQRHPCQEMVVAKELQQPIDCRTAPGTEAVLQIVHNLLGGKCSFPVRDPLQDMTASLSETIATIVETRHDMREPLVAGHPTMVVGVNL
jgi:hypothetical protein